LFCLFFSSIIFHGFFLHKFKITALEKYN